MTFHQQTIDIYSKRFRLRIFYNYSSVSLWRDKLSFFPRRPETFHTLVKLSLAYLALCKRLKYLKGCPHNFPNRKWCCMYVPFFPICLWEHLHALMPYIVGMDSKHKQFVTLNGHMKISILF